MIVQSDQTNALDIERVSTEIAQIVQARRSDDPGVVNTIVRSPVKPIPKPIEPIKPIIPIEPINPVIPIRWLDLTKPIEPIKRLDLTKPTTESSEPGSGVVTPKNTGVLKKRRETGTDEFSINQSGVQIVLEFYTRFGLSLYNVSEIVDALRDGANDAYDLVYKKHTGSGKKVDTSTIEKKVVIDLFFAQTRVDENRIGELIFASKESKFSFFLLFRI